MHVVTVAQSATHATPWDSWRQLARMLLQAGARPEDVAWNQGAQQASLFANTQADPCIKAPSNNAKVVVSKAFLELAHSVAAHSDSTRWALLYRMLWRQTLGGERALLAMATDSDVRQAGRWAKAVGRDIHKMHAFVRFRRVDDGLLEQHLPTERECFIAWFEPEHDIVRLAAPFFQRRFAAMNWSILTPRECVHWQGSELQFSPGVTRDHAPSDDVLDNLWRSYYRSIFNPARLKIKAMQSEMPKKYWKNLPEASVIEELIAQSQTRTQEMLVAEQRPVKAAPRNAYLQGLRGLDEGL
jgi:uracil-DNA glycosylase